jgi:hypothetical protein
VENPALVQTASETTPSKVLPEPLTLEYLLSDEYLIQSPQMLLQNARLKQVQSLILTNQTSTDWQANIEGRLGWREYAQESQNHNLLALHLGKVSRFRIISAIWK